jgi:demethylmenaquinone methyltransferase/2-methoxy-6-polyprenyl-1,4-benzoquinol methylase
MLGEHYPKGEIVGMDLTKEMLVLANGINHPEHVSFALGDMAKLDVEADSIDIVTGGYALRNAPDLAQALGEVERVLKPGGHAVFLDFSKSPNKVVQAVVFHLLKFWGSLWGLLIHRNAEVYGYIAESLRAYPDREKLRTLCTELGLETEISRLFFGGMLELRVLRKRV